MNEYRSYPILLTENEHREVMRYINHMRYIETIEEDMTHIQYVDGQGLRVQFPKFDVFRYFGFKTYGGFYEAFAAAKAFRDEIVAEYDIRPTKAGRPRNIVKRIW